LPAADQEPSWFCDVSRTVRIAAVLLLLLLLLLLMLLVPVATWR
jgi:hypothetical protein